MAQTKISVFVDEDLWRKFRSECVARKGIWPASAYAREAVETMARKQLQAWTAEKEALRILVQGPKEHNIVEAGQAFLHYGPEDATCETPCPEPVCRCGHFTLEWPAWEALQAEKEPQP